MFEAEKKSCKHIPQEKKSVCIRGWKKIHAHTKSPTPSPPPLPPSPQK